MVEFSIEAKITEVFETLSLQRDDNPGAYGVEVYQTSSAPLLSSFSPINGALLGTVRSSTPEEYDRIILDSQETFRKWRMVPAPERGQLVRAIGVALREKREALGALVTMEMGKILAEGIGEIQEAIDIADFAVGLSRQLYGRTMHSERPGHRMYEQYHPLGPVGVISAFNFPAAVWAWNAMVAAVCGDTIVWKPSELTPLTSLAMNSICREIAAEAGFPGLFSLVTSVGPELGKMMAADRRMPLVSATGSCRMGRSVAETVGKRLGRSLLELGGNNAIIVLEDADLKLAIPSIVFGAVGTSGERCTSTRRLYVHKSIAQGLEETLIDAYRQIRIGNPLDAATLMGPLIHEKAVADYLDALQRAEAEGGEILTDHGVVEGLPGGLYLKPVIVRARHEMPIVKEETFAPILYLMEIESLEEAIQKQNDVPQGLSSAIFTRDVRALEQFLSHEGSDCGIANVNIGTSGAEIGGAFGGEKDTGGGRESGSDAWKQYMRRQTNTINYSDQLPLAQGIEFKL